MTAEKEPVDLRNVEPVVRGHDPDEDVPPGEVEIGRAAAGAAATGNNPAGGLLIEPEDELPPDPDDLDRLRRG
jgi:hypothetical protein